MREDGQRRQARGHVVVVFTVADGARNQAAGGVVAAAWIEGATG
jgi:hypothetical protein